MASFWRFVFLQTPLDAQFHHPNPSYFTRLHWKNILGIDVFIYKMLGSIMINICNDKCSVPGWWSLSCFLPSWISYWLSQFMLYQLSAAIRYINCVREQLYYYNGFYTELDFRWKYNFGHTCDVYHLKVINRQHKRAYKIIQYTRVVNLPGSSV